MHINGWALAQDRERVLQFVRDNKLKVELDFKNSYMHEKYPLIVTDGVIKDVAYGFGDDLVELNLWFEGIGELEIDLVSLFPKNTWKGRENGLRADLVQLLADMKPGFLRFPGGCIVEGFDLSQRYQWKNTIGDPDERVWNINRWNFEFRHRPTPDYYQSNIIYDIFSFKSFPLDNNLILYLFKYNIYKTNFRFN